MHTGRTTGLILLLLALSGSTWCRAAGFEQTPGGVGYRDLQVGTGRVVANGAIATVHLTGWIRQQGPAERAFVDSRKQGQPLQFLVGTPRVMPGLNEGVIGMQAGGRRLLRIPPALAYGARVVEAIPAGSTLVFMVELLAVDTPPP